MQVETKIAVLEVADAVSNDRLPPKDVTTQLPSVTPKVDTPQNSVPSNATEDPAFFAVCKDFPEYSEDLLRSMLVCATFF